MEKYNKKYSDAINSSCYMIKELRYKKALKLLKPTRADRILEIGCNKGYFVNKLRFYSDNICGCDLNKSAIDSSIVEGLDVMPADSLGYKEASFDKVVSVHVIEHVPVVEKVLLEMERVLKIGGMCVIIYPFEPIRGCTNFYEAWKIYGNPFKSREIHLHKLNTSKIKKMTNMEVIDSGKYYTPYPENYLVLRKNS